MGRGEAQEVFINTIQCQSTEAYKQCQETQNDTIAIKLNELQCTGMYSVVTTHK